MTNHPNRSRYNSYVIMLPEARRLWKNHGAESEAIFSSAENARQTIAGLSGRGALAGAKVMRIVGPAPFARETPPEAAVYQDRWWLIDA